MIKDITQEVFLAIWKNARQFSGHSSVAAWVFSIARNKMMDKLRARYKRQEVLLDENQDDSIMKRDFTEQIVEDIGIDIALDSLEPIYKELTYLVLIQGLSYKEVARHFGIPEGTVKSRIYHLKKKLKVHLLEMRVEHDS